MSITAIAVKVVTSVATSVVFRTFAARLAFAALHKLAEHTSNKLDNEAVRIVEQAFYGDDRAQTKAVGALYSSVKGK